MVAKSDAENSFDDSKPAACGPRQAAVVDTEISDVLARAADGELSKPTVRARSAAIPARHSEGVEAGGVGAAAWSDVNGVDTGTPCHLDVV